MCLWKGVPLCFSPYYRRVRKEMPQRTRSYSFSGDKTRRPQRDTGQKRRKNQRGACAPRFVCCGELSIAAAGIGHATFSTDLQSVLLAFETDFGQGSAAVIVFHQGLVRLG